MFHDHIELVDARGGSGASSEDRARPDAPAAAAPMTRWEHADLTPHGSWTNYSVVPWLSLGRTRALLLSDEETLCRDVPTEPIFHHLELVVNCHQDRPGRPYKAGSPWASGSPPKVVANAVHKWYSSRGANINAKIDAINEAPWDAALRLACARHLSELLEAAGDRAGALAATPRKQAVSYTHLTLPTKA